MRRLPVHTDPEFPPGVDQPPTELDRRDLMKLLAASIALAGTGCMKKPTKRIMPRIEQPPELTPGVPLAYATSMVLDGYATGLVVTTNEARPTKVEGNPDHPASLGATTALHQASVLQLYDPHRATGPLRDGAPAELGMVLHTLASRAPIPGLWFLLHPQSSPLIEDQIARIRARHPTARFAFYSPAGRRAVHEGARIAFGRPLDVHYHFDRADVVVSLDADFLCAMPNSVRWSRDFAAHRRPSSPTAELSRLYVAEPRPTPTGSLADHRLPATPSEIRVIAQALLAAIDGKALATLPERHRQWVHAAAADLKAHPGRALVVVGDRQPKHIHALGHLINDAIGAIGATADLLQPATIEPLGDGLAELVDALRAHAVQTLVMAETNPLYAAPAELKLDELLATVPETIYAGFAQDETSRRCKWFVPLVHYMEAWGDARAYDGTISFIQPLIQPLHAGISLLELLAVFAGDPEPDGHALVLDRYRHGTSDLEVKAWETDLQRGVVLDSANQPEQAAIAADARAAIDAADRRPSPTTKRDAIELSFDVSLAVYDGRFATITWLQELPRPLDKMTWGNAATMSPATAEVLGVGIDDVVRLAAGDGSIELPVFVQPGHADGCVSVELGYGRWGAGPVADSVGANTYRIVPAATPWTTIASIEPTGTRQRIARTQEHWTLHDRPIVFDATIAEYRRDPEFTRERWREEASMLPPVFPNVPKWGMTIDTTICSGCSACVIACMAENNVPVVGADGVIGNREMHWLRIDTYREDKPSGEAAFVHQPMLCQHCEDAPCEYVCPVYATQHSPDGLNEMIYNRCVGTRFCSNNCPYKVRRFNWFDFTEDTPKTLQLQFNPNVTVRARGVMEKCSYCVQRIRAAEIAARRDKRDIAPGEVRTACQQACPTGAIQFGRLDHEDTTNVRWRNEARHYAVLSDLGTRPKTVYLAKIWNPSAEYDRE